MKKILFVKVIAIATFLLLVLSSCVSKKEIIYLQDVDTKLSPSDTTAYDTKIMKDDILRILVSSENMESVQPFNQIISNTSNNLNVQGQGVLQSYIVNNDGFINYPILGPVKVIGLSRMEVENKLQKELFKYVTDAVVDVRILNYKVTVIGEVSKPGTFMIEDNRITLLQALGLAGDLTIYGKRDNIIVLRDVNGVQQANRIDITSADFLYSPYYFLKQNDTVIVEPNGAQVQGAGFNRNVSIWVSVASLILSTIVVISNAGRN